MARGQFLELNSEEDWESFLRDELHIPEADASQYAKEFVDNGADFLALIGLHNSPDVLRDTFKVAKAGHVFHIIGYVASHIAAYNTPKPPPNVSQQPLDEIPSSSQPIRDSRP